MAGDKPLVAQDPLGTARELAIGIGRFHRACRNVVGIQSGQALAVISRLERLAWLQQRLPGLRSRAVSRFAAANSIANLLPRELREQVGPALTLLEAAWSSCSGSFRTELQRLSRHDWQQHYVLRDIHCQNALFLSGQLRAFIDFDALRVDTPATDLARLLGGIQFELQMGQWQSLEVDLVTLAVAAYRSFCPFSEAEETLMRRLMEISPLIALANWAVWIVDEPERFAGREEIAVKRMCTWATCVRMRMPPGGLS
jgi:hypothetical protein